MIKITRILPGELEEDINPEDFGFDVIKIDPPSPAEAAARIRKLYTQVKHRTGVVIPKTEKYLESVGAGHNTTSQDN
jgi:hypothetical protein